MEVYTLSDFSKFIWNQRFYKKFKNSKIKLVKHSMKLAMHRITGYVQRKVQKKLI